MNSVRIEITNYCNSKCAYCFFNDRLAPPKDEMTLDEFNYILDCCDREYREFVCIQGGEPTSHSNFIGFINILKKRGFRYNLLTNGIFENALLDELLINKDDSILVNYNSPDSYSSFQEWELVNRNLEKMAKNGINFAIGYNLYQSNPDYGYFIDAIKKYKISRIHWNLARPSEKFSNRYFDFSDYFKLIPTMVNFVKAYTNEGCPFTYDCPIPRCVILKEKFGFISGNTDVTAVSSPCDTLLNISAGLNLATCPASVVFEDIKLSDFSGILEAEAFVKKEVDEIRWGVWMSEGCDDCIHRITKECQGGCIGHKRVKQNKIVDRRALESFLRAKKDGRTAFGDTEKMSSAPIEAVTRCINRYSNDLKRGSPDPYIYYSLGVSYEVLEDYDSAIKAYADALTHQSNYIIAKNRLNLAYQLKAVRCNPRNSGAWTRLEDVLKQITGNKNKQDALMRQYKEKYSI